LCLTLTQERTAVRTPTRRQQLLIGGALAVAAAGTIAVLLWPADDHPQPARERAYKATTACLLTDDKGLMGDTARAAWAGMQEASLATLIKVQHLAITGPQNSANGLSYFNALGMQNCTVIIATGHAPVAAMVEGHDRFPHTKHVAVGGDTADTPLTTVAAESPATIQARIREIVATAA